ncbi:hypothetical protein MKX01_022912 [Papaver californicum]|nr:hypothetical protein MKX01_022912 [Papaver californicum]
MHLLKISRTTSKSYNRYGSVKKEIQALHARKLKLLSPYRENYPSLFSHPVNSAAQSPTGGLDRNSVLSSQSIIDLDSEDEVDVSAAISAEGMQTHSSQNIFLTPESNNVLVKDNSDEENGDQIGSKPDHSYDLEFSKMRHDPNYSDLQMSGAEQQVGSPMQTSYRAKQERRENCTSENSTSQRDNQVIKPAGAQTNPSYDSQSIFLKKPDGENPTKDVLGSDQ